MKDFSKLEEKINTTFNNQDLLRQAMVHRSYINEHPDFQLPHNERLEFLGDAVLELVVTEFLYNTYPNPEGELTNWRASLVNAKMLASIAQRLNFGDFLYLSRGESKDSNSKARQYILANAFEAVVGAMYIDGGWAPAKKFIDESVLTELPHIIEHKLYMDPKSRFQEGAQDKYGITPSYKVLSETGPDHNKLFVIGVFLADEKVAEGQGTSKQEGQVDAAQKALEVKGW